MSDLSHRPPGYFSTDEQYLLSNVFCQRTVRVLHRQMRCVRNDKHGHRECVYRPANDLYQYIEQAKQYSGDN